MFISLVRHGATAQNVASVLEGHSVTPLSELGKQQAYFVAAHLADRGVTLVYSSTAKRAEETARIISEKLQVPYFAEPSLNERDYGPFGGLSRPELLAKRNELGLSNVDPTQDWQGIPDVESDGKVWSRVRPLITLAMAESKNGHIVMVTHNGVIRAVLHRVMGIPAERRRCFRLSNCCVVILRTVSTCLELTELWQTPLDWPEQLR